MASERSSGSSNKYSRLMHEVCVGLGFCGTTKHGQPLHVDLFIPSVGPVKAEQFAEWVVLADNNNPNTSPHLMEIREAFVRHMGGAVVDARELQWPDLDETVLTEES